MEIARLYGALGFKFDPKGIEGFQKQLADARRDMVKLSSNIRSEVHKISAELSTLRSRMNITGGNFSSSKNFQHLKDAITQTKIALDSLSSRSSVYSSSIDRINNQARAGVPIWSAYRAEIKAVQTALQGLNGSLRSVNSASHITLTQRGTGGGIGGGSSRSMMDDKNNALALLLGGGAGGGLFNTARTAIVAGMSNAMVFGTGALIKNVIDRGRELRASEQVLMANSKNQNEYEYLNDWITKLSNRLGTNLIESQKAFGSIMMSARAGGGNLEQSQKVFTAFSEYGTTMHLSQETQERLLRAVQQTYTIQKIHGQELNQFANAGLNMKALLVDAVKEAYKVDDKTARKMATSGQAETVKVMPIIAEKLSALVRNNGALDRAMHSSQAEQGRFSNAFTQFSGNVMENGGDEALAKFFQILTKVVQMTNKFYDNMVGLNKLFSQMTGGNSAWIWALNLLIIMFGRGAISLKMFTRSGKAMLPMFWGVSRAMVKTRGIMGLLKAFMETPFMRVILAFAKRWLWIITIFQMVMTVGSAMNAHMKGYTTWFDVWVAYIKHLIVWFDLLYLKAYISMRKIAIATKLSMPDFNAQGEAQADNSIWGRAGRAMNVAKNFLATPAMIVTSGWDKLTGATPPDPEKIRRNTMTDIEATKQQNAENKRNVKVMVEVHDKTSGGVKATHVQSRTGTGAN